MSEIEQLKVFVADLEEKVKAEEEAQQILKDAMSDDVDTIVARLSAKVIAKQGIPPVPLSIEDEKPSTVENMFATIRNRLHANRKIK